MYILLALVASFALAIASPLPTSLQPRAGGPASTPIPAQCTTPEVKPASGSKSFKPIPAFATSKQIYAYYIPSNNMATDDQGGFQQCLHSCYGFGSTGECQSVLWAHDVKYTVRGSAGQGTACVFYSGKQLSSKLEDTTDGTYTDARAVNIECP